jgi:hypothetical protein
LLNPVSFSKAGLLLSGLLTMNLLAGIFDLKYMYYKDVNGVWNYTPALRLKGSPTNNINLQWDQEIDVVSGASRRLGMNRIGALGDHDLLLDGMSGASKREIRHSESVRMEYGKDEGKAGGSLSYSDETDYTSYGAAISASKDFNQRNTTLSSEIGWLEDDFHPQGEFQGLGGKKRIRSLSLGVFQILTRFSLAGVSLDYIRSDGYLGHPYLPVILANGALILENVPTVRNSVAGTATWIQGYRFAQKLGSIHLHYGLYADDWEMRSQSAEIQWYQYLIQDFGMRLRMRHYLQTSTGFARQSYQGNELYRVSDIRYYEFRYLSFGAKLFGSLPESLPAWLPDRWDIAYDQGLRGTRGELETGNPTKHYQLFSSSDFYRDGTFMAGLGFDW